jgi:hypothetical protein
MGLAFHNYHDTHLVLPYGVLPGEGGGILHARDCWFQRILPFVDQQNLYNQYEADPSYYVFYMPVSINGKVIPMFMCPSDPSSPGFGASGVDTAFQGNYAVASGIGASSTVDANSFITVTDRETVANDAGGLFGYGSKRGLRDCTDGTSNTLLVSEGIIRGNVPVGAWGELGGYWGGGPHGSYSFSAAEVPNTSVADRVYLCKLNSLPSAPKSAPCESGSTLGLAGRWNYARSFHIGGVQATLADGSVRFISDNIDRQTWMKLGKRNDGQVLGEF